MEFLMSIKTKIAAVALAALAVTGGLASTTTQAHAGGGGLGWGIGAGLIGAAVVGTAIAANSGPYYGMAAIAAALSFASSMSTATTSAPFAAAITTDNRL